MSFREFAAAHGLILDYAQSDGLIHRVPTVSHPRKRNGAYLWDGESGFVQDWAEHPAAIAYREQRRDIPQVDRRMIQARRAAQEQQKAQEHRDAAQRARKLVATASSAPHPYLARKGFPDTIGLTDPDGWLLIPMRMRANLPGGPVCSVQRIAPDGTKRFMAGGATKGRVHSIGPKMCDQTWIVEGYATGLSIAAALKTMYRQHDRVIVSFSAGNLQYVGQYFPGAIVCADHDESGVGEAAARATGLRWTMPDRATWDFNDLHQIDGAGAVAEKLRRAIR